MSIANMMGVRIRICDKQMHQQLKDDLVEHGVDLNVMKTTTGIGCFFQIILVYFNNLCFHVFILKTYV